MNNRQHLLVCLAEECAEAQQAVSKALRFGLQDGYPGTTRTTCGDIACEINHLLAVVEMLQDAGALLHNNIPNRSCIENKKIKVQKFMEYAKNHGTLDIKESK